ncbi:MAG: CpsB/CapC family capsule biosynthesis tyrosine phosphatase [Coprococcus sp.]
MNGGRYVLVEFSSRHDYQRVRNYIYHSRKRYYPVVAHVSDILK